MAGFDARLAKRLQPGQHIVVDDFPGLRLVASTSGHAWIYRYNAAGSMRQIKLGQWPALSLPAAVAKWQDIKDARSLGTDPAIERKAARKVKEQVYTVAQAVEDYITGHLYVNRQPVGANAVAARLRKATQSIANRYYKNVLWSPSYFAASCGGAPLSVIKQYVEQQDRPL